MSLETILATKGSEVVSIDFTTDLAAAAKLLTKHRIGALVVLGVGGRLAGVLSERDIVRTIAESGSAVLQLPVAQVMTRNVSTCDVNESINSVIDRMTKGKFRHMPVLNNDRLAGMISIGDVLKWYIETIRDHIHQLEVSIADFDMMNSSAIFHSVVCRSSTKLESLVSYPKAIFCVAGRLARACPSCKGTRSSAL